MSTLLSPPFYGSTIKNLDNGIIPTLDPADFWAIQQGSTDETYRATIAQLDSRYQSYSVNLDAWALVNPSSYLTAAQIASAYQPLDAELTAIAGLTPTDSNFIVGNGSTWIVESGATARSSLGLGSMAVIDDAPIDGSQYARQDGAWAVVTGGGGGGGNPFADDTALVKNASDPTKLAILSAAGISTGTTRTLTLPDVSSTVAVLGAAQTFTAAQTVNTNSAAALLVEQDGVNDNTLVVDTANGRVGIGSQPLAKFDLGGLFTPSLFPLIVGAVSADVNNVSGIEMTNMSTGTSAEFRFLVSAGGAGSYLSFTFPGANNTSTLFGNNRNTFAGVFTGGAAGRDLLLGTFNAGDDILFATANTARGRLLSTGELVLGANAPGTPALLTASITDAVDGVVNVLDIGHRISGTPSSSVFGVGMIFRLKTSTASHTQAGRFVSVWNVATHASRAADLIGYASDYAGEREIWRGRASGTAPQFAVLGATPVARQAHIADPSGGGTQDAEARTAINSILAALENFGFLATS